MTQTLQFGEKKPGLTYHDRPTAFGVAVREGRIACAKITGDGKTGYDLPGGALDAGESEEDALVREFAEETGLIVRAGDPLGRAGQYFVKANGKPLNNLCAFFQVEVTGEDPAAKCEDDHELVWLEPREALEKLKHDAHAWAVTAWLRRG